MLPFMDPAVQAMPDTSAAVAQVVAELANHPDACPLATDLADRMRRDVVDVWDALDEAERGGWVELWPDDPRGPSAVLSALSAERLGLTLSSNGKRWLSQGECDHTDPDGPMDIILADANSKSKFGTGMLDEMADIQALEGLDSLLLMERLAKMADDYVASLMASSSKPQPDGLTKLARAWRGFGESIRRSRLPEPIMILGQSPPWPVRMTSTEPCPGCGSRKLWACAYCLVCHRSGIDHLLEVADPLPAGPGAVEVNAALENVSRKTGKKGKR